MKFITRFFSMFTAFLFGAMLLKFYVDGDAYISISYFIDNLPPLGVAEIFDETVTNLQMAVAYASDVFDNGFQFKDVFELMKSYYFVILTLLKLSIVDLTALLIEVILWLFKVFALITLPTDPILTPFDKGIII